MIAAILIVLVLVALAGAAGYWQQHMNDQLRTTRHSLAKTSTDLIQTRATLAETKNALSNTQMELDAKSNQLTDTQARLRQAQRKLSGLQGSLSNAQDRLDLQANQIETLKSCLNGVTSSLTYAAQGDYTAALAALDAVQVSCQRAESML